MNKILAIAVKDEYVYASVLKKNQVIRTVSGPLTAARDSREAVANSVRQFLEEEKVNVTEAAMSIDDSKCFFKEIDAENLTRREFELNLPYDFAEYSLNGSERKYTFDYEVLPPVEGKGKRVLAVAALREDIKSLSDFAEDMGLKLVKVVPETCALRNLFDVYSKEKKHLVVTCEELQTVIRVFKNGEKVASNVLETGIGEVIEELRIKDLSIRDLATKEHNETYQAPSVVVNMDILAEKITSSIDHYFTQGLLAKDTPILINGIAALCKPFVEILQDVSKRECYTMRGLINGHIRTDEAAVLAPAIGAALTV